MFKIITKGKPNLDSFDPQDTEVKDAIYTIYCNDDDFMIFINWNGFKIPMDGVGFSQIYNDVIIMLEELEEECNKFSINFLDSGLTAIWNFTIEDSLVAVDADWIDIASYGFKNTTVEELDKKPKSVKMCKLDFINEWNSLLKIIKEDLLRAGYSNDLEGFEYLDSL